MSVLNTSLHDGILTVAINRPEKKNTLTPEVVDGIDGAIQSNRSARVIVFKGEGGFFCAGADVSQFLNMEGKEAEAFSLRGNRLMDSIQNSDAVSIAAIRGGAYGGGFELALSCDIRIASPDAKLGLTEINLGILPGFGGLRRLIEIGGKGAARYLGLTGKVLSGKEAFDLGLVTILSDDPEKAADELAASLAVKSTHSIARIKRLLSQEHYSEEKEAKFFGEVVETREAREAVSKFLKR
ncbi:MAG: enoyl-CoA hydratase/isomerase family protein [Candidatus Thermoplasmatota archaeon]|jgi:enoyl-CoA hydratase/carnithine racemase|nr:enoyl-CoA hydratase/isomerase family protein [Candidatus Thermoplasmatota archaeon]